ncbi:endo alpha-1,4 polygalactosaminidase [Arthrobacter agilis]|nr:hypothetical protein B8W74_12125 [Arthrobacter agilis]PPB47327.1 hypothetical protein CI784_02610 [Arthrobacter agilis]TPV27129.1 endo alpha-1,4 polygalactosaminidase [Arthrobacter agilis]
MLRRWTRVAVILLLGATSAVACSPQDDPRPFPAGVSWDYQLGGAYEPDEGVGVVVRSVDSGPAEGLYSICYVNAFQSQPGEAAGWLTDGLVLEVDGTPMVDPEWPDEYLLDTGTAARRQAIAARAVRVLRTCAEQGFDAVELDNLDSYRRSEGRLALADNVALAEVLLRESHALGLLVGQKNAAEEAAGLERVGFDFAIAEQCIEFAECAAYTAVYGDAVLAVEYPGPSADDPCAAGDRPASTVVRDRELRAAGEPGHVFRTC